MNITIENFDQRWSLAEVKFEVIEFATFWRFLRELQVLAYRREIGVGISHKQPNIAVIIFITRQTDHLKLYQGINFSHQQAMAA